MASELNNSYRKNGFSIWRIVFTLVIMLFHFVSGTTFYKEYPWVCYHWYIAVEFFFILSGYLLMQHIDINKEEGTGAYIIKRIVRLYPEYLIAFLVMACIKSYTTGLNILKILIPNWHEALMLQSTGISDFPYINNPAWYVSALLIGSYFVHFMIKNHRKNYLGIIAPIIIIVTLSFFYNEFGAMENFYTVKNLYMNTALLRAISGLTIGSYIYIASSNIRGRIKGIGRLLLCFTELAMFMGTLLFAITVEEGSYDFLFYLIFAMGVLLSSDDFILGRIANNKLIRWMDKISYSMYLSHFAAMFFISLVIDMSKEWNWWYVPVYIISTIVLAIIYNLVAKGVMKLAAKIASRIMISE